MKYDGFLVDYSEGIYTGIIRVKKWFGWVTIKTIESDDDEYILNYIEEVIELLENE